MYLFVLMIAQMCKCIQICIFVFVCVRCEDDCADGRWEGYQRLASPGNCIVCASGRPTLKTSNNNSTEEETAAESNFPLV